MILSCWSVRKRSILTHPKPDYPSVPSRNPFLWRLVPVDFMHDAWHNHVGVMGRKKGDGIDWLPDVIQVLSVWSKTILSLILLSSFAMQVYHFNSALLYFKCFHNRWIIYAPLYSEFNRHILFHHKQKHSFNCCANWRKKYNMDEMYVLPTSHCWSNKFLLVYGAMTLQSHQIWRQ